MLVYYSDGRCFGSCITRFKRWGKHWMFDLANVRERKKGEGEGEGEGKGRGKVKGLGLW